MLSIQSVSKSYQKTFKAVDNISLEICDGEIFGFLGPNGAGKTTLLKMMTGILAPDQGRIIVHGHDIMVEATAAKESFGFVPDDPNYFLRLRGVEYLKFIADIYRVPKDQRAARISELAHSFGMDTALGDRILSYSHGMRQKIMVMGALLHRPPLWILDEPMTGLDPQSSYILKSMMRQHANTGKSVIFSTHVLEVAEKVCDRVAIIDKGRLLFCGSLEELQRERGAGTLEDLFLDLVADAEKLEKNGEENGKSREAI